MAFEDYRMRNYMAPPSYGGNFNLSTGAGPWATQPTAPKPFTGMNFQGPQMQPPPFTGMEIQGPIRGPNSFARQPEPIEQPEIEEPASFRGMEIQGPLGSTPGRPNYEAPERPEIQMPGQEPKEDKEFDIFEAMYNAPTPALEAYKRHIMSMPKQEDYRAGKYDRVAAALAGMSEARHKGGGAGYKAARDVVDTRFNAALQNYANQGQGLGQLAELESNDMKSKMGYAKTMMEQRRADTKEAREGKRTDAEVAKLEAELPLIGKTIETSSADGQKYVVDKVKGTRTSLGKFDLTPEEKAEIERKTHKINVGVDFGKEKGMAGVRFGFDKQMAGVNQQNAKDLALFKAPLEVQTAIDKAVGEYNALAPSKNAAQVDIANQIRDFAARNPIPSSGFDRMQPSQTDIAFDSAVKQVAMAYPGYMKFVTDDVAANAKAAKADEAGYTDFQNKVKAKNDEIVGAAKPKAVGGQQPSAPYTPKPFVPAVAPPPKVYQSPISAPSAPDDPMRAQAIQLIKDNKPELAGDEAAIAEVIRQLRGQ